MARAKKKASKLFGAVLLCDDIRQEKNGKYIAIGIYSGDVLLPSFPTAFAPQVYAEHYASEPGEFPFSARYSINGQQKAEIKALLRVNAAGQVAISMPPVVLELQEPCTLTVELSLEGLGVETPIEKRIRLNPNGSTAFEQPSSQSPPDAPAS